jgi:putative addiction module antidote
MSNLAPLRPISNPIIPSSRRCIASEPGWRSSARSQCGRPDFPVLVPGGYGVRFLHSLYGHCRCHRRSPISALKLTQIGNSVGVILPKELLAKLGVGKGDTVYAIDQPDGIRLTVADPDFEAQMAVARKLMKRWRNVLRELAK